MKTIVPSNRLINSLLIIVSVLLFSLNLQAQTGVTTNTTLNFSADPVLVAGTNNKAGAKYKYENVAPGLDAILSIDSLAGGATINTIDDNTGKNGGYIEGLQPQITSGPSVGYSYAVFTISLKITGTDVDQKLDTFSLTALDIDGTKTLKEFDQISLGTGATAWYMGSNPTISLTRVGAGTFMGINTDGVTRNGVDTSAKSNMFTITNTNVSSFTAKLGILNDHSTKTLRLFSIYMKGFDYPDMAVMPITLQSFTTTLNNNTEVNVKWTTVTQSNVSHFVVQRSIDGKNFNEAGIVFSNGNSTKAVNYSLTDNISPVKANLIYYRLCTVDLDGRLQYSDIRTVRISQTAAQNISIVTYPNPSSNELRVTIPFTWQNKRVSYELYNVYGQLSKRVEEGSSSQTETINVSKLPTGMYIMKVICEGQSFIQKVIKF
ncbi:MAG: T9SS type A sorting domain-containing protein [Bacteroidota bacterium]|nr:T9SS type A sorting domain-containing protein [Bacteroidota bacterium]